MRRRREEAAPVLALLKRLRPLVRREPHLSFLMARAENGVALQHESWGTFYYLEGKVFAADDTARAAAPKLPALPASMDMSALESALTSCCRGVEGTDLYRVEIERAFRVWLLPVVLVAGIVFPLVFWLWLTVQNLVSWTRSLFGPRRIYCYGSSVECSKVLLRAGDNFYAVTMLPTHAADCSLLKVLDDLIKRYANCARYCDTGEYRLGDFLVERFTTHFVRPDYLRIESEECDVENVPQRLLRLTWDGTKGVVRIIDPCDEDVEVTGTLEAALDAAHGFSAVTYIPSLLTGWRSLVSDIAFTRLEHRGEELRLFAEQEPDSLWEFDLSAEPCRILRIRLSCQSFDGKPLESSLVLDAQFDDDVSLPSEGSGD